jgi:nitrite reductase/ring-hydroxylating ferredoxin subunit
MGILSRIFGICKTKPPADPSCWQLSGDTVEIDLTRAPELTSKGTAVRLEGNGLPNRVLLVHGNDGHIHAFHNKCTHAGRRIDPLPGEDKVECCSVGKTTWDYQGALISGSGKKDLARFDVQREGDKVTVRLPDVH